MANKKVLNEKQLEGVSGGGEHDIPNKDYKQALVCVCCPCGCDKKYFSDISITSIVGAQLGVCNNGWVATTAGNWQVNFYNPSTRETKTGKFEGCETERVDPEKVSWKL